MPTKNTPAQKKTAARAKAPAKTTKTTKKEIVTQIDPVTVLQRLEEPKRTTNGAHKIDLSKGKHDGRLHKEWCSRPNDQRYLDFPSLFEAVKNRRKHAIQDLVEVNKIEVENNRMNFRVEGMEKPLRLTNFAMGQIKSMIGLSSGGTQLLETIPEELAAKVVQHKIKEIKGGEAKLTVYDYPEEDFSELGSFHTPTYYTIWDEDICEVIADILHQDPRWKVPGQIDWTTMEHNPYEEVTKESTTLYASDRDMATFFCQDADPVEAGKTARGLPDLYFRGFYVSNSLMTSAVISTFWLRGVCQNRNLWGCEGFQEVRCKHTKKGLERFRKEALDQMYHMRKADNNDGALQFAELLDKARNKRLASNHEDAMNVLKKALFSKRESHLLITNYEKEEAQPFPISAYDFSTATTAYAKRTPYQDKRTQIEEKGKVFLECAA